METTPQPQVHRKTEFKCLHLRADCPTAYYTQTAKPNTIIFLIAIVTHESGRQSDRTAQPFRIRHQEICNFVYNTARIANPHQRLCTCDAAYACQGSSRFLIHQPHLIIAIECLVSRHPRHTNTNTRGLGIYDNMT